MALDKSRYFWIFFCISQAIVCWVKGIVVQNRMVNGWYKQFLYSHSGPVKKFWILTTLYSHLFQHLGLLSSTYFTFRHFINTDQSENIIWSSDYQKIGIQHSVSLCPPTLEKLKRHIPLACPCVCARLFVPPLQNLSRYSFEISYMDSSSKNNWHIFFLSLDYPPLWSYAPFKG